jgi:hypothetical protein
VLRTFQDPSLSRDHSEQLEDQEAIDDPFKAVFPDVSDNGDAESAVSSIQNPFSLYHELEKEGGSQMMDDFVQLKETQNLDIDHEEFQSGDILLKESSLA